ncbi:MAG TPA: TIGR02453 family protein [Planctomycetaceae bacterium]|nr:TIGR02453 family protein [Planctomycetaceae bacterium]|tara:strand:- start:202 stop:897 length:696 start_codon:yes stop_codon:yes gene_type:complete
MAEQTTTCFPTDTLKFLKDLKKNNQREWLAENKQRYEEFYLEPALGFITAMQKPLKKISPFLEAIPKKMGGSLLRIYRDTRFSNDKTPYKTHIGMQFRHEAGGNIHAPGCYLHIEPGNAFIAVGTWHPERDPLLWIRQKIAEEPKVWQKAITQKKFATHFEMAGDKLIRPPKGFDKEHPAIEEIKRKDFIAVSKFEEQDVTSEDFQKQVVERLRAGTPLMTFLCEALELSY